MTDLEWGLTERGKRRQDTWDDPAEYARVLFSRTADNVSDLTVNGVPLADVLRYSAEASDLAAEQKYEDWGTHEMCAAALRALAGRDSDD
jgi:hypothetical protein